MLLLRDTVGAEDSNAYDRYAVATCLRGTVVEIIGGVAFPGSRTRGMATLIMRIFFLRSAFHSQIRDSRINNRLYGILGIGTSID